MQFKTVTHVIFDMDGLLIGILLHAATSQIISEAVDTVFDNEEFISVIGSKTCIWDIHILVEVCGTTGISDTESKSESIYDKIIDGIAQEYGKSYTEECKIKVLGTPEVDTARIVVNELGLPITPEEFLKIYKKRQIEELAHPPLLPGAKELVKHLHKNEIPIAVATSSSQEAMQLKTKDHQEMFKLFHHIVCGSTDPAVKSGKPAPDIFLVCASRFPDKPSPSNCLVFEDAPNGIKGAISAGMQAVMVPAPYIPNDLTKQATQSLKSLTHFKPELFGLPAIN